MKHVSTALVLVILAATLILTACARNETPAAASTDTTATVATAPKDATAAEAATRMQEVIGTVADTIVKEVDAANKAGKKDPAVTREIEYYQSLTPADRVKTVVTDRDKLKDIFSAWGDPTENLPSPAEARRGGIVFNPARATKPEDFNLAIARTDLYAQQVRLTNELFRDLDPKALSALEAYEKLTPDQKRTFMRTANASIDYYYWNYLYLRYQLWMLRYYYLVSRECYWGYKTPAASQHAALDDRAFDLPRQTRAK